MNFDVSTDENGWGIRHLSSIEDNLTYVPMRNSTICGEEKEERYKWKFDAEFDETPSTYVTVHSFDASVRLASVCIYAGGEPLCDIIPLHTCGRFVSLADFCRLTRKHPWTLPPPFTFNLYQSIQPSQNRTYEPRNGRRRALFTPDSSSTLRVLRALPSTDHHHHHHHHRRRRPFPCSSLNTFCRVHRLLTHAHDQPLAPRPAILIVVLMARVQ